MKLCAPCLKALEKGTRDGMCTRCVRRLSAVLASTESAAQWPPFWLLEPGEFVGVPGMSGMGKSHFQKAWTQHHMDEGVPTYWWDPMREASKHGTRRGGAELGPLLTQVTVSEWEASRESPLCRVEPGAKAPAVAIVPDEEHPTRQQRAAAFCRAMGMFLADKPEGTAALFLAECGLLEGEEEAEEVLGEIATTWRKEGVAAVFDTQSGNAVPVRARDQRKVIVAFKQVGRADRTALTALVNGNYSDAVRRLPPFHALLADRMADREWGDEQAA